MNFACSDYQTFGIKNITISNDDLMNVGYVGAIYNFEKE